MAAAVERGVDLGCRQATLVVVVVVGCWLPRVVDDDVKMV